MRGTKGLFALVSVSALLASLSLAQEPATQDLRRTVVPAAASNPVAGSGSVGQITKWIGVDGANTFTLGDSDITEDKFGKVGIGTRTPTSPLTVGGTIETTAGGIKYPDGTLQTTAGIAQSQAVKSLNGLRGDLALAAGPNITITPSGATLTIAATGAEEPGRTPYQETQDFAFTGLCGLGACEVPFSAVPAGKRLVIKNVSASFSISPGVIVTQLYLLPDSATRIYVPLSFQGSVGGPEPYGAYTANQQVLAYAEGGSTPSIFVSASANPGAFVQCVTLTGYYVSVP